MRSATGNKASLEQLWVGGLNQSLELILRLRKSRPHNRDVVLLKFLQGELGGRAGHELIARGRLWEGDHLAQALSLAQDSDKPAQHP